MIRINVHDVRKVLAVHKVCGKEVSAREVPTIGKISVPFSLSEELTLSGILSKTIKGFGMVVGTMMSGKKIVVVMPAYNAAKTLRKTYDEVMVQGVVDQIVVVDDSSCDETASIARSLSGVQLHIHSKNRGYGGNQKTCYRLALEADADIIIMIHPDYQYTPALIPAMASMIASGLYPCVLGSRILGGGALKGGMPWWKYISNRVLTAVENVLLGAKLSEYHTGYRAFSSELLKQLQLEENSDDFVFDNQMLAQILWRNQTVAEISCPTKYFPEASSINFKRSFFYGLGCLWTGLSFRLCRMGIFRSRLFRQPVV